MINDIRFDLKPEQTLEQWIVDTIAPVNDMIYSISSQITGILNGVEEDVC